MTSFLLAEKQSAKAQATTHGFNRVAATRGDQIVKRPVFPPKQRKGDGISASP